MIYRSFQTIQTPGFGQERCSNACGITSDYIIFLKRICGEWIALKQCKQVQANQYKIEYISSKS
jgi:hypothetical protein